MGAQLVSAAYFALIVLFSPGAADIVHTDNRVDYQADEQRFSIRLAGAQHQLAAKELVSGL